MRKMTYFTLFFVFIASMLTGCSNSSEEAIKNTDRKVLEKIPVESTRDIEEYLAGKGYTVLSSPVKVETYKLGKSMLIDFPDQSIWGLQDCEPSDYIGKDIELYKCKVKDHPLDSYKGNINHRTNSWVMVCENNIIGGYSFPDFDDAPPELVPVGGCYSLDGRTLEEVTGIDFQEWREKWVKKYSNNDKG